MNACLASSDSHIAMMSILSFVLFQGHSAEIISLAFNANGEKLITGSFDHTVSVWDVAGGRYVFI